MNFFRKMDLYYEALRSDEVEQARQKLKALEGKLASNVRAKVAVESVRSAMGAFFRSQGLEEEGREVTRDVVLARARHDPSKGERWAFALRDAFTNHGETEDGEWELVPEATA